MKYFKPKSVTWWSGIGLFVAAIATSIIEKRIDFDGFIQASAVIGIRGALN